MPCLLISKVLADESIRAAAAVAVADGADGCSDDHVEECPVLLADLKNIVVSTCGGPAAGRSYILAYNSHALKEIFNVHTLDLQVGSKPCGD